MMQMPMHYYDAEAEADFRLTNHRGWRRGRPQLDYQDYQSGWRRGRPRLDYQDYQNLRYSEIKTHSTTLNIKKGFEREIRTDQLRSK